MRLCVAMSTGRNWVLGSQTSHYVSENALCLQFIWLLIMDAVKGVLLFTFLQKPLDCLHLQMQLLHYITFIVGLLIYVLACMAVSFSLHCHA